MIDIEAVLAHREARHLKTFLLIDDILEQQRWADERKAEKRREKLLKKTDKILETHT